MTFDDEHRLVLACALLPAARAGAFRIDSAVAAVRSWDRVLSIASANQVRPQLASALSRATLQSPGARDTRSSAESAARVNVGQSLLRTADLVMALDALRAAGIPAVPFKGPVFAALVTDGPAVREMSDLDLLVRPKDLAAATRALRPLGFESRVPDRLLASQWLESGGFELGLERPHDRGLLELHWRLAPPWHPVPITVDDVFARISDRDAVGTRVAWPAPEELFLAHVADAMKSSGEGMRWIGDLLAILQVHPSMDWDGIEKVARRNGGFNTVCVAMAVVEDAVETAFFAVQQAAAFALPPPAQRIAERARRTPRLRAARDAIQERLATDRRVASASRRFLCAVQVSDRPVKASARIARYLANPTVQDLEAAPEGRLGTAGLRWRALRRRMGLRP